MASQQPGLHAAYERDPPAPLAHPTSATPPRSIAHDDPHDVRFRTAGRPQPRDPKHPPERQRLVDVVGARRRAPHDLLHRDERRVSREQAIGQPQRRDLGHALLARGSGTEVGQIAMRVRAQRCRRAAWLASELAARRESTSDTRRDRSVPEISIDPAAPRATFRRRRSDGWQTGPGPSRLDVVGVESRERHVDPGEHGRVDVAPQPRCRLRRLVWLRHDERLAETRARDALDEEPVHAAADTEREEVGVVELPRT